MAKLIAPDRKLGVVRRRLVTDANGAPCCCGQVSACCTTVDPSRECEYVEVSTEDGGFEGSPCNTYRMKRYGTVDVTYELVIRYSTADVYTNTPQRRSLTISAGLTAQLSFCYARNTLPGRGYFYEPSSVGSIAGAYYDQSEETYSNGQTASREYVAIGEATGTRMSLLPVVTQNPALYFPEIAFGSHAVVENRRLTQVPAHFTASNELATYDSQTYINSPSGSAGAGRRRYFYCQLSETFREFAPCTGALTVSHEYADDGTSGGFRYLLSDVSRCLYRTYPSSPVYLTTSRNVQVEYLARWTRRPCPCTSGPSELTTPEPAPLQPSSALDLL